MPSMQKGKLSAFQLLKSWLFDRQAGAGTPAETEFLNTRDGHELAKFAKQAFGNEATRHAEKAAVDAEQAEIDALLQGTGAVPMPTSVRAAGATAGASVDQAVAHLEKLRGQGFSVEMLAEALIVIESREVKARQGRTT